MLVVYASDPDWTADSDRAMKTAKVLEALEYQWFEEPLAPTAFDDFMRLTQTAGVAIAGAEHFVLLRDFETLANRRAVDILQPDCTRVGLLASMAMGFLTWLNALIVAPEFPGDLLGLMAGLVTRLVVPPLTQKFDPPKPLRNGDGEEVAFTDRLGSIPTFSRAR